MVQRGPPQLRTQWICTGGGERVLLPRQWSTEKPLSQETCSELLSVPLKCSPRVRAHTHQTNAWQSYVLVGRTKWQSFLRKHKC